MSSEDTDLVVEICAKYDHRADALLEILLDIQLRQTCVSDVSARAVAQALNISRAEVQGVRSFYADLSIEPRDPNRVRLCRAEACQALGAERLAAELDQAGLAHDAIYCLGNCALGPAALIGDRLIGRASLAVLLAAGPEGADHG